MALIELTNGGSVALDDKDALIYCEQKWHNTPNGVTTTRCKKRTLLHRLIAGASKDYQVVFKDGNRLNCHRDNLELRPVRGGENTVTTKGKYASITAYYRKTQPYEIGCDRADLPLVTRYRWFIVNQQGRFCAVGYQKEERNVYRCKSIYFHQLIIGPIDSDKVIDHIDRSPLNNRRSNLRVVYGYENAQNIVFKNRTKKIPPNIFKTKNAKGHKRYSVRISLGGYGTKQEALDVVKKFRSEHYPWSKEAVGATPCPCLKDVLPNGVAG